MKDFFVSYNKADEQWAVWIAWILEEAKYTVVIEAWDFLAGGNFVLEMQKAAVETERTIAVLSQDYLDAEYTHSEWAAAFARDPRGQEGKLIPIRVAKCQSEGLLAAGIYIDVIGLPEKEARQKILTKIKRERIKPSQPPPFPGLGALQLAMARVAPTPAIYPGPAPAPPDVWPVRLRKHLGRQWKAYLVCVLLLLGIIGWRVIDHISRRPLPECGEITVSLDHFNKNQWVIPAGVVYKIQSDTGLNLDQASTPIFWRECHYRDFKAIFHIRLTNDGGAAWVLRVQDEEDYYLFYLAGPGSHVLKPGFYSYIVRNNRFDPNNYQDFASPIVADYLRAGVQFEIVVEATGQKIKNSIIPARVEGQEPLPGTGEETPLDLFEDPRLHFASGGFGFRTVGSEQFSVYDIKASPLL